MKMCAIGEYAKWKEVHQEKVRIEIKGNMRKRQMKVSTLEEYGKRHKFAHISAIIKTN